MNKDLPYDIEVYPNIFTCVIYSPEHDEYITFEVSERQNDFDEMCQTLIDFGREGYRMIGFNNLGYDYPVLHHLLSLWKNRPHSDWKKVTKHAKEKNDAIFATDFDNRFVHMVWKSEEVVEQVDLMKIHHFDNTARATSLKAIEFAARSKNIGDLPYDPDKNVPRKGFDALIKYNKHDVKETFRFYKASKGKFELRERLGKKYGRDFTNHNDGKIGRDIFQNGLEERLGKDSCVYYENKKKKIRQTKRKSIDLSEVIFDYIEFETPQFKAILKWFNNQIITETKGVLTEVPFDQCKEFLWYADKQPKKGKLKKVNVIVGGEYRDVSELPGRAYKSTITGGLKYIFGTGGLHASVESSSWYSDDEYVIVDVDVTSYYPMLAIINNVYPEHLGPEFCEIYLDIFKQRMKYEKGTAENLAFKLALNVPYGDSNSKYSFLYDPKYTMTITLNGQLSLCMLAEQFMKIDGLTILQANTDGVTVRLKRKDRERFDKMCRSWEKLTGLELEDAVYKAMHIGNVNNYLSIYDKLDDDGNPVVKRKGKYEWDADWHQNHSQKVVAKAVEAHLVHGTDVREFIENHDDMYDFYMVAKCNRNSRIVLRKGKNDEEMQRVNRYYASTDGGDMIKIMPPIKKKLSKKLLNDFKKLGAEFTDEELREIEISLDEIDHFDIDALKEQGYDAAQIKAFELCQPKDREIGMTKDSPVTVHNKIKKLKNINYDYYVAEANKIIDYKLKLDE